MTDDPLLDIVTQKKRSQKNHKYRQEQRRKSPVVPYRAEPFINLPDRHYGLSQQRQRISGMYCRCIHRPNDLKNIVCHHSCLILYHQDQNLNLIAKIKIISINNDNT